MENKRIRKEEKKVGIVQAGDVEIGRGGESQIRAICFAEKNRQSELAQELDEDTQRWLLSC